MKGLVFELSENPWIYIIKLYPTSKERKKVLKYLIEIEEVITR